MIIIGVDFHPEFQQIAFVDTDTGEFREQRLTHREEAERFYRTLAARRAAGACRHGSKRTWPLVRTIAGRVATRVVDRRCGRDPEKASTKA
jgi:hypothetical protein